MGVENIMDKPIIDRDGVTYRIAYTCLGNTVVIREDGKECILPPWVGGYSLTSEWAGIEAILASNKLSVTDGATGKRLGWLGGRYIDNGKPIDGADNLELELVFV